MQRDTVIVMTNDRRPEQVDVLEASLFSGPKRQPEHVLQDPSRADSGVQMAPSSRVNRRGKGSLSVELAHESKILCVPDVVSRVYHTVVLMILGYMRSELCLNKLLGILTGGWRVNPWGVLAGGLTSAQHPCGP
jgi:hypothetical protein